MIVEVLCFGALKDICGAAPLSIGLPDGARVTFLLDALRGDSPVWKTLAVAVNREYAGLDTELHDGDEVALLPPVSGGCLAG